jgi:hypothetical protein
MEHPTKKKPRHNLMERGFNLTAIYRRGIRGITFPPHDGET